MEKEEIVVYAPYPMKREEREKFMKDRRISGVTLWLITWGYHPRSGEDR